MTTKQVVQTAVRRYIEDTKKGLKNQPGEIKELSELFLSYIEGLDTLPGELAIGGARLCGGVSDSLASEIACIMQMTHGFIMMNKDTIQARLAAESGLSAAFIKLINCDAPEEYRVKAMSITNRALLLSLRAQALKDTDGRDALLARSTELVLNPLHVGMVFTGVGCPETDAITEYAMSYGFALTTADKSEQGMYLQQAQKALDQITMWNSQELEPIAILLHSRVGTGVQSAV